MTLRHPVALSKVQKYMCVRERLCVRVRERVRVRVCVCKREREIEKHECIMSHI